MEEDEFFEVHGRFELPFASPKYPPEAKYRIEHLLLEINVEPAKRYIRGKAHYTISPIGGVSTDEIALDAAELNIVSVKRNGKKVPFEYYADKLHIRTGNLNEQEKIEIEYDGHPEEGMHFVLPDSDNPDKPIQAWTQGEDEYSRYWYPCFDAPNMKFTTEFHVTVPGNLTVLSNGKLKKVLKGKNDTTTFIWEERAPHSSYLNSIVVGEFAVIEERYGKIPVTYYVRKGKEEEARRSFSETPKMIAFFSDYIGVDYPYEKYAQATVADFMWGGMENISATTLTEDTLHDSRAHNDYPSEPLVAHELAHQWWGDLLTTKDWSNIWLNEGFATYFTALYLEKSRGKEELINYMDSLASIYFQEDSAKYRRPVVQRRYFVPGELFDRTTYQKGAWVLHMLRNEMGDGLFRSSIREYCTQNRYRNVETSDFIRAIEAATGKNMQEFFDQWVFSPGYPELKVKCSYKNSSVVELTVSQTQSRDSGTPLFRCPLRVAIVHKGKRREETVRLTGEESKFTWKVEERPSYVSIDPYNELLKKIDYDRPVEDAINQLDRGSIYEKMCAARELSKKSRRDAVAALERALSRDEFYAVHAECCQALGRMNRRDALEVLLRAEIKDSRARKFQARAIGEYRDASALSRLEGFLDDESYAVEAEAISALAKLGRSSIEIIKGAMSKKSHMDVVLSTCLSSFGEFAEAEDLPLLSSYLSGKYSWRVRGAALSSIARLAREHARARQIITEQLKQSSHLYRLRAIEAAADAGSREFIPVLSSILEMERDGRIRRAAYDAVDKIRRDAERPGEMDALRDAVEKLRGDVLELRHKVDELEQRLSDRA